MIFGLIFFMIKKGKIIFKSFKYMFEYVTQYYNFEK